MQAAESGGTGLGAQGDGHVPHRLAGRRPGAVSCLPRPARGVTGLAAVGAAPAWFGPDYDMRVAASHAMALPPITVRNSIPSPQRQIDYGRRMAGSATLAAAHRSAGSGRDVTEARCDRRLRAVPHGHA
jgi:hypothetical protein